jgi:Glycosyl-4,4'-diaponeurosporenoate acyltransferase
MVETKQMQPTKGFLLSPRVLISGYNAAANVFWSVLAFAPVSVFCYRFMGRPWLSAFVVVSLLPLLVPTSTLRFLELSSAVRTYRKLGVHLVNHVVQHGTLINKLLRQKYPEYGRMRYRTRTAGLMQSTYIQERFHWAVLLFFLLASVYGIAHGQLGWALLIAIINVGFNLYPIWLQQYIRVRLNRTRPN